MSIFLLITDKQGTNLTKLSEIKWKTLRLSGSSKLSSGLCSVVNVIAVENSTEKVLSEVSYFFFKLTRKQTPNWFCI
jgi:hypothetical protein